MELYVFILAVLFATAIADLIVGVSNDAVNFLNSALGSKAAPRRTVMIIAAFGVLMGTTFSSGMMEVARKGIFNPEYFTMHEVMIIFLAVMLTDILLLDLYNTFGLPTSTTVSIVFEILGGAVALAVIKVSRIDGNAAEILNHINSAKVVTIVASIGLSVVFAFVFGVLIQFLTRLIFTFNYEKTFRRYGALYCGFALSAITYFILLKGAKGSTLISPENAAWIKENIFAVITISFVVWSVIWQLVLLFTKINVLKIVVLIGTFALALAFAANDLVNFIGAPLGALSAFKIGTSGPVFDPNSTMMDALAKPVKANTWILLLAGAIMVVTLWRSRKAQSVTKTEINLGRQEEGIERFESSLLARAIVRISLAFSELIKKIVPNSVQGWVANRINPENYKPERAKDGEMPSFDLLRAAVNLTVASALVSLGTSLKLPLSTTFVTFMVAMSTSLADKSWGRESAVYRVNGVLTVIGGWFVTAFMAFSACFIFAGFIYFGKLPAIIILVLFGFYFYFRSAKIHKKREEKFARLDKEIGPEAGAQTRIQRIFQDSSKLLDFVAEIISQNLEALIHGDRKQLRKTIELTQSLHDESHGLTNNILKFMRMAPESLGELTPLYAHEVGAIEIVVSNIDALTKDTYKHIDNNHKEPEGEQAEELKQAKDQLLKILGNSSRMLELMKFDQISGLTDELDEFKKQLKKFNKHQMKRIKKKVCGTRQSLLFVTSLSKIGHIAEQAVAINRIFAEQQPDSDS